MFYKIQISKENSQFMYPVDNVNLIEGAKYRKDMNECVCIYPNDISDNIDTEKITETEYNQYPQLRINLDKKQIQSNDADIVNVAVTSPETIDGEQVNLYIDSNLAKFKTTDTNQIIFELTADSSQAGKVLEITADSFNWKLSKKVLLEVI